jgi:hypothetical protein
MRLMRFVVALVLALGLAASASAQQIYAPSEAMQPSQYYALVARIDSFNSAMKTNDMATIMSVIPPKVLDAISAQYGVTNEQLIEAGQQQLNAAMQTVKLESFGMDLENGEFYRLADDTLYGLLPTETVMDLGEAGGKIRAKAATLALLDGETWYLVRVEDAQQVGILKTVYPQFADVTFPTGSMEPVTE